MHKKSWIKYLSAGMFFALVALCGSNTCLRAEDEASQPDSVVVESTNSEYSRVEKNGVVLSSIDDIFYSSASSRKEFLLKLDVSDDSISFNRAYYYDRLGNQVTIIESEQKSVEFSYVLFTNRAEVQLTVFYTTTTNSNEQSISIYFSRDVNAPIIENLVIDEMNSVMSSNQYKSVKLTTSVSETGIVQSGIEKVEYYIIEDGEKKDINLVDGDYDLANLELTLESLNGSTASLCVVATDKVGLSNTVCSETFHFDNEGPVITLSPDDKANEILSNHQVKVQVTDSKTNVSKISYEWLTLDTYFANEDDFKAYMESYDYTQLAFAKDAESEDILSTVGANNNIKVFVLVVRAEDSLGNISYGYSNQLRVQSTATPYTLSTTEDLSVAKSKHSVELGISNQKVDSLEEVIYAWAKLANGYPSTYEDLKNAIDASTYDVAGSLTLNGSLQYNIEANGLDGEYILLVGFKTTDGNAYVVDSYSTYGISTFMFDNAKPIVMLDPNGNVESAKQNYVLNITVNESNMDSNVYYMLVDQKNDSITADDIKLNGTKVIVDSKLFQLNLPANVEDKLNGKYYLYLLIADKAGNEIITTQSFLFDNTAPVVDVLVKDEYYSNNNNVSIIVDDESNITKYEYSWVKNTEQIDLSKVVFETVTENVIPTTAIIADGEYVLVVRVTDEAGNVSDVYVSGVFKFDVSLPVIKGVENNGYYTNLVKIEAEDVNELTLTLNGKVIENGTEIAESGFYRLSVEDALGNKVDSYFVVNVDGKTTVNEKSVKVERQQYAPIKVDENGKYYVEVARGTYSKDSVIVLTKSLETGYVILDQDTAHVSISKDLKSTLSIRKYKLEVSDETVISENADEDGIYGYVYLQVVTFESAVKLGIEKTIIDNEVATLSLGLAGSFALIGIYFVSKSKKTRI